MIRFFFWLTLAGSPLRPMRVWIARKKTRAKGRQNDMEPSRYPMIIAAIIL
jgi:hypothetical protein